MRSSADNTFWKTVGDWQRFQSQIRVRLLTALQDSFFDGSVLRFVVGASVTFKEGESGKERRLDLFGAEIRPVSLPFPPEKAKGFEELEFGSVFNIMWEDDDETRCTLSEIRDFGKQV